MSVLLEYLAKDIIIYHAKDQILLEPKPSMHYDMHEICYLFSGQVQFYVEGSSYTLTPGCMILIRAGEVHYPLIDASSYENAAIHFHPSMLADIDPRGLLSAPFLDRQPGRRNFYPPESHGQETVRGAVDAICGVDASLPDADPEQRLRILCNLSALLFELRRRFRGAEVHSSESRPDLIGQVITYIDGHLTEPFQLKTLTDRFFVNGDYLNFKFRQVVGSSIWQYTISKRLLLARQRISEGVPPTRAAEQSGWKDYSSFYRQYKARFGVSPGFTGKNER